MQRNNNHSVSAGSVEKDWNILTGKLVGKIRGNIARKNTRTHTHTPSIKCGSIFFSWKEWRVFLLCTFVFSTLWLAHWWCWKEDERKMIYCRIFFSRKVVNCFQLKLESDLFSFEKIIPCYLSFYCVSTQKVFDFFYHSQQTNVNSFYAMWTSWKVQMPPLKIVSISLAKINIDNVNFKMSLDEE